MIDDKQLSEIEARANAATEITPQRLKEMERCAHMLRPDTSRRWILALIAAVRELQAENERLKERLREHVSRNDAETGGGE